MSSIIVGKAVETIVWSNAERNTDVLGAKAEDEIELNSSNECHHLVGPLACD